MNEQKLANDFKEAFNYHLEGKRDKAELVYKSILKINPNDFDTLRHLGILYQDKKMYEMAEKYYMKAFKVNSSHFAIYNNLGTIKFLQFKMEEALDFYKQAFKMNRRFVPVINNICAFYHRSRREEECMEFAQLALSLEPENLITKANYGRALSINNKLEEAIEVFKEIINKKPDASNFSDIATAYRDFGEVEKSYEYFQKALKLDPTNIGCFFSLSASKLNQPNKPALLSFEKILKNADNLDYGEKGALAFGLYNSYHKIQDHEKASKYLLLGNKFLDNWVSTDINEEENLFNEIKEIFNPRFIERNALKSKRINNLELPTPIFILGMPRSGTTLCEQIISSHSDVAGGGELPYLVDISEIGRTMNVNKEQIITYKKKIGNMNSEDFINKHKEYISKLQKISTKHKFITDKMPHNFVLIGLIKILYPNAKIIYCKRNAIDNCFSLFTHKFLDKSHGYCYNQKILGKYYNLHLKLMDYWLSIFKDEILIENQEKYSREIIEYSGLGWQESCLEFYKTKRQIQTASNEQVREPINKKSISAWKKYEEFLGPLKKYLSN